MMSIKRRKLKLYNKTQEVKQMAQDNALLTKMVYIPKSKTSNKLLNAWNGLGRTKPQN